jgi:hypothetical protein
MPGRLVGFPWLRLASSAVIMVAEAGLTISVEESLES